MIDYDLKPTVNEKTKENIWILSFPERLPKEHFQPLLKKLRYYSASYSFFRKGFIFKYEPNRKKIEAAIKEVIKDYVPQETEPKPNKKPAAVKVAPAQSQNQPVAAQPESTPKKEEPSATSLSEQYLNDFE